MSALTDNFDSYTDGDLNGQGSWSGGTDFDIQGTTTQGGAKAVLNTAAASSSISKNFTGSATGVQSLYGRTADVTSDAVWSIRMGESGSAKHYIKTNGGQVQYFNGAAYANLGAVSADTWFKLDIQWDASTDQARYRLNDGTWTSYYSGVATYTQISTVILVKDSADTDDAFWDSFSDGESVAPTFIPRISFIM